MQRPIIVGIDPGTTIGYSVFDLNGNFIFANSIKNVSLAVLTKEILEHGIPLIVAVDRKDAPNFVKKLAASFGAKIFCPQEDLKIWRKNKITSELEKKEKIKFKNYHESDATAAAVFAYKFLATGFAKISDSLRTSGKKELEESVKTLILKKNAKNIDEAISFLEK